MNDVLFEKLMRLEWLLKRKHMLEASRGRFKFDHARGQGRVLAALNLKDGISTRDLSYVLGIAVPSLNEMLAKLDKAGLIERKPSSEDKRIMLSFITDKGREASSAKEKEREGIDIFAVLSKEEQGNFELYLDKVNAELETYLEDKYKDFNEKMRNAEKERMRLASEGAPFNFGPIYLAPEVGSPHGIGPVYLAPEVKPPHVFGPEYLPPEGRGPHGFGPGFPPPEGRGPHGFGPGFPPPEGRGPFGFKPGFPPPEGAPNGFEPGFPPPGEAPNGYEPGFPPPEGAPNGYLADGEGK